MGQYFILVNLDKREYVHAHRIGGGLKLFEWCANREAGVFPYLLRKSDDTGGGDVHIDNPEYAGRWASDRIVLIGDYDESGLYSQAEKEFTEISEGLVKEYNEFIEIPDCQLRHSQGTDHIVPDMVLTANGEMHQKPKIKVHESGNLAKPPSPDAPKSELAGGWRKHQTHREETRAVKKALEKAGIHPKKVGHDTGTAWGWLVVNLGPNPSGLEHEHPRDKWPASQYDPVYCPACKRNDDIENEALRIAKEVTGRHGEFNGEISVLRQ